LKIIAHIPALHFIEIKYTIEVLFVEFLGMDVAFMESSNRKIKLEIGERNVIFQSDYFELENIISRNSLPQNIIEKEVEIDQKSFKLFNLYQGSISHANWNIDVDVLGSTFFMLTRWEEYVIKERDSHNRFSAKNSVAFKFGFLDRPIVNEYVELLWVILQNLGCTQKRKSRKYKIVPTHDVDRPFLFMDLLSNIRRAGGFVKRKNLRELLSFASHLFRGVDPWDTHDLFMDMSEKKGVKSHFFFLVNGGNRHDEKHSPSHPKLKKLYKKVKERGHHIGFHPSYDSFDDEQMFNNQKNKLEEVVNEKLVNGRQHYLRFSLPETWQMWNNAGMKWDSSMSYADCAGFRCGVCYPYPVFDVLEREKLQLFERPLIVMEGSLVGYEKLDLESASKKIARLKEQTKKYNGEFIFLYHNSSFFDDNYVNFGNQLLEEMYK